MKQIKFKMSEVKKIYEAIIEHQKNKGEFRPTRDMLFDEKNYDGGQLLDENGQTEQDSKLDYFFPSYKNIKKECITPQFQLVGDQGVYLMSNICSTEKSKSKLIAYAQDCNPDQDDDWYENKVYLFGGDDGVLDIPISWMELNLKEKPKARLFRIGITDDSIQLKI
jgi:hypothetical protein